MNTNIYGQKVVVILDKEANIFPETDMAILIIVVILDKTLWHLGVNYPTVLL